MLKKSNDVAGLKKKLKESEDLVKIISRGKYQWQATFDAITDPVIIISENFEIIRANLMVAALSGKDIKNIIGEKCYKVFASRESECIACPVVEAKRTIESVKSELGNDIKNREYIARAFPFMDKVDNEQSYVVHYRDVTEERRLQQELVQQEKMAAIGMLAGGVAHEINNPLGGIIAFAQLLIKDANENDPIKDDLLEIENAALRCKKIVKDLLDFSRMSSGKEKHTLEINPLIEKVVPFIKRELQSLNVHLDTDFAKNIPVVYGDANRLEQVFLNLMTNACHSMKKGGDLNICTYFDQENKQVCIDVKDSGCGIAPEDTSKIFDPFFTTKRPGEGTGLGLSISYRIIRDHGGSIRVRSKFGEGTKFTVCLPVPVST